MSSESLIFDCFNCAATLTVACDVRQCECPTCEMEWLFKLCRKCRATATMTYNNAGSWTCPLCSKDNSFDAKWSTLAAALSGDVNLVPGFASRRQTAGRTTLTPTVEEGDALRPWRDWASTRVWPEAEDAVLGAALGILAVGLGAQRQDEIDAFIQTGLSHSSGLSIPESLDALDASTVVDILSQLLSAGWEPPARQTDGLTLRRDERVLATSTHERWVYTGKAVNYSRGGFFAFGSPLFLAATVLGSVALSGARKAAAERQAATQWRFAGRGRMSLTSHRFVLWEQTMTVIEFDDLLGTHLEGQHINLVVSSGTPMSLQLPHSADLHFTLYQHLAGSLTTASGAGALSRAPTVGQARTESVLVSPDGRYWWDAGQWIPLNTALPPGAVKSPDGTQWYDGTAWRDLPS